MAIKVKENLRRLTALALAAVMTIGSSITIYANELEIAQTSAANAAGNDEKVRIILPTDAVGIFDFILDPQELIYKTNASAYEGKLFEEGATLFFKRSESEALVDYSSISDAVTITNRGSTSVDAVITASITVIARDEFAMTDDKEFTDDKRPSLYLALTDGETEVPIMGEGEEAASLTITIPPASEEGEEGDNEYAFRLTGAANKGGDWSRMKDISFQVAVTWMVIAEEETLEEKTTPENEEVGQAEEQNIVPSISDPGEEIVRKIVPVITDSNVSLDEEKDGTPVTEEKLYNSTEEDTTEVKVRSEVQKEQLVIQREEPAVKDELEVEDTENVVDEKRGSP